jgi:hypothetical protein
MISRVLFIAGIVVSVVALFLLSPLADYLPIDLIPRLGQLLTGGGSASNYYHRVVPGEVSRVPELAALGAGFVLILLSFFLKKVGQRNASKTK